jgi:arylsulfatase A-like enzyme
MFAARRIPQIVLALLVLAGIGWWFSRDALRARRAHRRAPRIVLVTLDTLHVDHTGPYNPAVETTPNLDRIAREGVVFEHAYAPVPSTLPSHASLMTGHDPADLGILVNGQRAPEEAVTLAEILSQAGYRTGAVISLGVLRKRFGLRQGFEFYEDSLFRERRRWYLRADEVLAAATGWIRQVGDEPFFLWVHLSDPHEPYQLGEGAPDAQLSLDGEVIGAWNVINKERYLARIRLPPGRHTLTWTSLRPPREDDFPETALALRFLRTSELQQWLADPKVDLKKDQSLASPLEIELENPGTKTVDVFHMFSGKFDLPPPSEVIEAYDQEVAYADRHIGLLEELLESMGLADDTLWVIASDHGEGLYNHQILGHAVYAQEDHLRMVWMMRGPGVATGYRETHAEALSADVLPTVLELLGLPAPEPVTGRSRVPCWTGTCEPRNEWWSFAASAEEKRVTAVAGYRWPYKVLWQPEPGSGCYQLEEDPGENINLCPRWESSEGVPRQIAVLERDLRQHLAELQRTLDASEDGAGDEDAREADEMLRSLGYVGNQPQSPNLPPTSEPPGGAPDS